MSDHKLLEFEKVQRDLIYAITINPADSMQMFDSIERFKDAITVNERFIRKCFNNCAEMVLFPELTKGGRIHFHGIIKFHDVYEWFEHTVHNLTQRNQVELDTLSYGGIWHTYIMKQRPFHQYLWRKGWIKNPQCPIKIGFEIPSTFKTFYSADKDVDDR